MIKQRIAVERMTPYNPPTSVRKGKMRFDFNESTVGPSPKVLAAFRQLNAEDFSLYPEYSQLRRAIAGYCNTAWKNVFPGNGGDGCLQALFEAFVEENDEVIIPSPSFAMFYFYAQLRNSQIRKVPYNKDLTFPKKEVLAALSPKTKMLILCNPNNPTGTSINQNDLLELIRQAKQKSIIVLVDEAYFEFSGQTVANYVKKFDNLFVLRSLSKAFGLAGLRLGFILSQKQNIEVLLKSASPYAVSSLTAIAGIEALKDKAFIQRYVAEIARSKQILCRELKELSFSVYPSQANFVLVDCGEKVNQIVESLSQKNILVRDRSKYNLLQGCVRITLGTVPQTMLLIQKLNEILRCSNE